MESRMTVVQALEERDLLVKRILSRIQKAQFVDFIRAGGTTTRERRLTRTEFERQAEGALQQIKALIAYYDKLCFAISVSNASTLLETSVGEMTVACAILLRGRMRGNSVYGDLADFEGRLARRLEAVYPEYLEYARKRNDVIRRENARIQPGRQEGTVVLLKSADGTKKRAEKENPAERAGKTGGEEKDAGRQGPVREKGSAREKGPDRLQVFDPLDVRQRAQELEEQREALLAELDAKIKISNATTFLTV